MEQGVPIRSRNNIELLTKEELDTLGKGVELNT
jgi:hypothetical protein